MAHTPLQQLITERILHSGPITFAEYMRMALYEPTYGYYVTGPTKIGWEGDYYTSTDISPFFANCMGRQLQQMWEKLGQPLHFIVLEQGAGRAHLAHGVRTWAQQQAPDFNTALDYHTADIHTGQDVNAEQNHRIVGAGLAPAQPTALLPPTPLAIASPSVILSNELIDAFPVHIVETRDKQLYELYIDVQHGRLCEVVAEPSTAEVAGYLDRYSIPWQSFGDGWRAEINLDALHWMERVASLIQRGFILTIDYGDKARALYTRSRRRGTLACYAHHQMHERMLLHPGENDITAHVNFSALIAAGRCHGLRLNTFTTQRLWLAGLGIHEELEQCRRDDFPEADTERASDKGQIALLKWYNLRQRVAALTDAAGMGNFKVLILKR